MQQTARAMQQPGTEARRHGWGKILAAVLCVCLLLLVGMLSATHEHADGLNHSDCGLCSTSHVSVLAVAVIALLAVPQVFQRAAFDLPVAPHLDFIEFALFTRPPPPAATLS